MKHEFYPYDIQQFSSYPTQSVQRLATGWTVRESNPGGRTRFSVACPDQPWSPPNLLYEGVLISPYPGQEGKKLQRANSGSIQRIPTKLNTILSRLL